MNGIDIDLSNFRYAELDETGHLVTIGGATNFLEVWDALWPAGKEVRRSLPEVVCKGPLPHI